MEWSRFIDTWMNTRGDNEFTGSRGSQMCRVLWCQVLFNNAEVTNGPNAWEFLLEGFYFFFSENLVNIMQKMCVQHARVRNQTLYILECVQLLNEMSSCFNQNITSKKLYYQNISFEIHRQCNIINY